MKTLRSRLSYANVMATIAVFVALGGGAIAATQLPKKSVGPKQLKANAVKTGKIADGAVTQAKLASGAAVKGVVAREVVVSNLGTNASQVEDIQCNAGEHAIGGGAAGTIVGTRNFPGLDVDTQVLADGPINAAEDAVASGERATGWHISAKVLSGPRDLHLYALCAQG